VLARHDLANRIAVLMGGRASEALIFDGEVSTGAADDLQRATEIALQMVTRFGMDGTVGQRTYSRCPSRSWWRSRATCLPARSGAPTSSRSRAAIPKGRGSRRRPAAPLRCHRRDRKRQPPRSRAAPFRALFYGLGSDGTDGSPFLSPVELLSKLQNPVNDFVGSLRHFSVQLAKFLVHVDLVEVEGSQEFCLSRCTGQFAADVG
jgi:hypothetical protein